MFVNVNADIGEGFGPYSAGNDEELLRIVSSANIACGFHAGDALIMKSTVARAKALNVDIGAHPGFADRTYFGRRPLPFDDDRLKAEIIYQFGALQAIAKSEQASVGHVTFHGALGNLVYKNEQLADLVVGALAQLSPDLIMPVTPNTAIHKSCLKYGLPVVEKFFADRAYTREGHLAPRNQPGAVIKDPDAVGERLVGLLRTGTVKTIDGDTLPLKARMVVLHGDTQGSISLAHKIKAAIDECGAQIKPLSQIIASESIN